MTKWKTLKFLMWDERAIRQNKKRNKGSHINQLERLHVVLCEEAGLVFKKRKHYGGTSHGDVIGPVIAPAWDEPLKQFALNIFTNMLKHVETLKHHWH